MRIEVFFIALLCTTIANAADTELQLYRPFTETSKQLPFFITKKKRVIV